MTLTLADISVELDAELRHRAASEQRSVDQVAVDALQAGLALGSAVRPADLLPGLAVSIRARLSPLRGIDLPDSVREPMRNPSEFGG